MYIGLKVKYPHYYCQILMKIEFYEKKNTNIKFDGKPSSDNRVFFSKQMDNGRTDRRT